MELNFRDYLLAIITLVIIYLLYKMMVVENMTDDVLNDKNIHQIVKDVYQIDIQAIRNLGDLSKKIFDQDNGKLILPHDVEIRGNITATGTGQFGVAKIGTGWGGGAEFTHKDGFNTRNYTLRSYGTGDAFVNVPSGKTIYFRQNDEDKATIKSQKVNTNGVEIRGNITATGTGQFGVAKIGTGYGSGAEFTHKDGFNTRNYTLRSYGTGDAFVNVPSGKTIYFRQNDEDKATIKSQKVNTNGVTAKEYKIVDSNNGYRGVIKAVSGLPKSVGGGQGVGMFNWSSYGKGNGVGVSDKGGSYSTWVRSKGSKVNNYAWIRQ